MPEEKKKLILAGILTVIIFAVGFFIYQQFLAPGKLIITPIPTGVDIQINGKLYKNVIDPLKLDLRTGNYKIKLSKKDYFPKEDLIKIKGFKTLKKTYTLEEKPEIELLLNKEIEFPTLSKDESYLYYLPKAGDSFERLDLETFFTETISMPNLAFIHLVLWSPTKDLALILVKNNRLYLEAIGSKLVSWNVSDGALLWWLYNFTGFLIATQNVAQLNPNIKTVSWSPLGDKIIYVYQTEEEKSLVIANPSGSNYQRIANLEEIDFLPIPLYSPDGEKIALFGIDKTKLPQDIYLFDLINKELKKLTDNGVSWGAKFSPDSSKILYERFENGKSYLWVMNSDGTDKRNLKVEGELKKTIWFDNKSIITAIKDEATGKEELYLINVETAKTFKIPHKEFAENLDIGNLLLTTDKNFLYFTSKGKPYRLRLKL